MKSKLKSIFFKPKLVFSLILLGFFVFLPTNFAKAETFASDGVVFKTGLEVGGKPDNLVRVVKGSPINFSSVITVTSLKTQSGSAAQRIVIGTDRFDTATEGYFSAVTIRNVGLGVEIIGDLGNTCSNLAVSNLIGNSTKFVKCDFPGGKKDIAGSQVLVGQTYKMDFSVSASSYQALKLDQSKVGVAQKIAVYPYLDLDVIDIRMRDINLTITDAYQTVYVVYYNTQAELDAAVQRGDRAGAGNYGESTGSTKVDGSGNGIVGLINKILAAILGIVQEFIFLVFFYLIAPLIQAMLSVRVYTDEFAAVIYPGWEVVRNLSNIIFIVALIAIAIGTLLRIESYQFRPMLIQLILAALLVNFSLVIAQAILGVADTIQNQFLPNNVEVIRALAKDLMVSYRSSFLNDSVADTGYFAVTVKQLFYVALSIGSFLVFLAICVFLVVRIVMLWILLMLSPLAYAAGVLPATAGVRSEWWGTFLKYAFFTPIMAFFLNMTAVISNAQQNNPVLQRILNDSTSLGGDSKFAGFVVSVSSNILLLVFLIVALMVAEKAGIYGADAVTKIAKGGMLAPFGGAKWLGEKGLGYAGRKWNDFTSNIRGHEEKISFKRAAAFAILNPVAAIKGYKKQSEERDHRSQAKAEAVGLEIAEQRFSSPKAFFKGSYKRNPHVLQHEKEEEDEQAKKLQNLSREEVARRLHQFYMMGTSDEDMAYKRGGYKLAMSKGYVDDGVGLAHTNDEGRKMIQEMIDKGWLHIDENDGEDYNTSDLVEVVEDPATGNRVATRNKVLRKANGEFWSKNTRTGVETKIDNKNVGLVGNSHSTRRAFQLALFGGELHREKQNGFYSASTGEFYTGSQRNTADVAGKNIVDTYHIKDHAASRLIAQEGETEGRATRHWEYMTDQKANSKTGEFESYPLRKVYDSTNNRFMYVSDGESQMSAAEIAKEEGRQGARIAPHAIVSEDGSHFSRANYAVWAKLVRENPGFVPERNANFFVTGYQSAIAPEVEENLASFKSSYTLNLENPNFGRILKSMHEENKHAFITVLTKFSGLDRKLIEDRFVAGGPGITINDKNGNLVTKITP